MRHETKIEQLDSFREQISKIKYLRNQYQNIDYVVDRYEKQKLFF